LDLWVVGLVRIFLIYHDFKLNVYRLNIHKVDIKINIMFNSLCNFNGVVYERIRKAIQIAGDATKLAEKLDVSSMTISHWKHRHGGAVPQSRVFQIFRVTGVTPHELRPDLYPNPNDGLSSQNLAG
jgi:DNA-binding transcriptional regulator YdaS (Cro superfamily)